MKILYVITKGNWGGAQRYVYDVALAAHEAGHEVAVAYGEDGEMRARLEAARIRTIPIPSLGRNVAAGKDVGAYRHLRQLFAQELPDTVHINSSKAGGIGCFAARMAGVPQIIFTAHGWAFNEDRPGWQKFLIQILSGITVLLSDTTICVSEAIRKQIAWVPGIKKKLTVIPNGIACTALKPRAQARAELVPHQEHKIWIGMISELHPTKRIIDALHAMKDLIASFPELILVVLGEGGERAMLEEHIGILGLRDQVFLLGFTKEAGTYAHAFDIFLHASRSESLGYVLLEAGCACLPVVACRVGGIPEIIESGVNGLLAQPEKPSQLADAIEWYLRNPDQARAYGAALHQTVTQKFSKEKMLAATLALYKIKASK